MQNLPTTLLPFPFAGGLQTRGDKRAKSPPALDICKDVEFDDIGGLRTRYPYAFSSASIFGGGTLSNIRRYARRDDELLVFTKDALYSWNAQLSKWVLKGTYLAVKTSEESRFVNTADQLDCDRAELNGTIVYTWTQNVGSTSQGYVAAIDKTTGSILMAPTALAGSAARLRVTALTTKILLTFYDGVNGLYVYALDPAAPATALAGASTTVTNTNFNVYYDIVRIGSTDQALFVTRQNPTTSYWIGTITAALVVAKSSKGRTCDGPIAVAADPTGVKAQVIRGNGTNVQGDLITISTLADVYTAQAVGTILPTTINQITCAYRSVQNSGQYRCYAFWSSNESADTQVAYVVKSNWVDTGNSLGTQGNFICHTGLASRAFGHDGSVYVSIVFAAAAYATVGGSAGRQLQGVLQNTYFLYRDDGLLAAKAAPGVAGGFAASIGALPGVASIATNTYAWAGVERRYIPLGGNLSAYSDRSPRDITIEFDTNEARRCAQLGKTLYLAGGEVMQYDGAGLYEVGFHIYPWNLDLFDSAAGNLAAGDYAYKMTWRWDNAQGERERSTTATIAVVTMAASRKMQSAPYHTLNITHKTTQPPAAELWRTAVNPSEDAPFYLVTKTDPTQTTGDNRYAANDQTAFALANIVDNYADSTATALETNPENGGFLENVSPPAASIIVASDVRLFIAGIASDPNRVMYSKQRADGEVAAFNDALTVQVPPEGGAITAMAIATDGTPIVFRETATYVLLNDGFDNAGGGQNYVARRASPDFGAVSQESIAVIDTGVVFKSSKGWCLLNRAFSVDYIGAPVYAYDSEQPLAAHVMPGQHQVRILTSSRMLVWDYLVNQWGEWTISGGLDATLWNDTHLYLTSAGPYVQQSTYTGVSYGWDVETTWIKTGGDLQGNSIVRIFEVLGEFRANCSVRVRCARNYESDGAGGWSYNYDKIRGVTPTVVGGPLQLKIAPSVKRPIQAFKVRLTALAPDQVSAPNNDTCKLTGLVLAVAAEAGAYSGLPVNQKL